MPAPVGTWRSLVAYLNGVQGVPGSNPGVPTKQTPTKTNLPKANPPVFLTFREMTRGSRFSSCWLLLVFFRVRIRTQVRTHAGGPHPASSRRRSSPTHKRRIARNRRSGSSESQEKNDVLASSLGGPSSASGSVGPTQALAPLSTCPPRRIVASWSTLPNQCWRRSRDSSGPALLRSSRR